MNKYQKILVAIDFSELTDAVMQSALSLAKHNSATIAVLNVVDYAWPTDTDLIMPSVDEAEERIVAVAQKRLEALLKTSGEPSLERIVVAGQPKQEILRIAEQEKADLIVMGAHGHHGLSGLLGSTTDRVAHRASCDVLIVHR